MAQLDTLDVIRAWKDPQYMNSLPQEVRARIPEAPDGIDQISDQDLEAAAGGSSPACIAAGAAVVSAAAAVANVIDHWS